MMTCISANGLLSMSGWEPFLAVVSSKRMCIISSVSILPNATRHYKLPLIVFQNLIARQKTTYKKGFHFENLSPTKPLPISPAMRSK